MKNEILREVWDNRDKFARRCKHNLNLMAKTLREVEHRINNPKVDPTRKTPAKHRSAV
jgi:hypothetical protein